MRHISYTVVIPNGSAALTTREMMMFDIVVSFNNLKSLSQLYVVDNCNVNIAIIRDYFLSKKLLISDIKHGEYKYLSLMVYMSDNRLQDLRDC